MDEQSIIETALKKYFPDAKISVYSIQMMSKTFQVGIQLKTIDFVFFIENGFIKDIQSKSDCFETVKNTFNFHFPNCEHLTPINTFIENFYNKSKFNKIFEDFPVIAIDSLYQFEDLKEQNYAILTHVSDNYLIKSKFHKKYYSIFVKCYFKMTNNQELLCVPTLSFFNGNDIKFEVSLNTENNTMYLVEKHSLYHDDFFNENPVFTPDIHFDLLFNQFINEHIMKIIDPSDELGRQLESLGDDIDTKVNLLLMYSI